MTDHRPRILAIDDVPANLLTLGVALAGDFNLQIAASGAMGLTLAEQSPPDLILLDVMMPEMDGYETCRRIKASPLLAMIPVIFVTSLTEGDAESHGLALGAADYITKPIIIGIAMQRIRNLLEREQLRKEVEKHRDHLEEVVAVRTMELRRLGFLLAMTEERERRTIAQDLHDDLCQVLVVMKLKLTSVKIPARSKWRDDVERQLKDVENLLDKVNSSVRSLSLQLSPPVALESGFASALEWLAGQMRHTYGLSVRIDCDEDPAPIDKALSSLLFRTVRELLINVAKHAQVTDAKVCLRTGDGMLHITITDAGCGFDADQGVLPTTAGGFGLFSIRERLKAIDGEMQIDSQPGGGTKVFLRMPLNALPVQAIGVPIS